MNRRQFLASTATLVATPSLLSAAPTTRTTTSAPASQPAIPVPEDLVWHNVQDWGRARAGDGAVIGSGALEGRAFNDTKAYFDRLPARAEATVRDAVWTRSRHTAGMSVHFHVESPELYVRYSVTNPALALPHLAATAMSGVDLYVHLADRYRFLAVCKPTQQTTAAPLTRSLPPGRHTCHVNLPLYNGITSLELGVPKGAHLSPIPARTQKPLLFYGTSVTQGACASRPGMAYPAILGRRLDRPIQNFGFSGNGTMDPEVGALLAELDPAVYVIDCVGNTSAEQIQERTAPLVRQLRKSRPTTPILLLEGHCILHDTFLPDGAEEDQLRHRALREAFDHLTADGVLNLYYRTGGDLLGDDFDATVDLGHATDLGMHRYANALEPDLRKILA